MELGKVQEGEYRHMPLRGLPADLQDLVVSVQRLTPSTLEFDLVGVDASIANALRRVMIAEVS